MQNWSHLNTIQKIITLTESKGQVCFDDELRYGLPGYIASVLDYLQELDGKAQLPKITIWVTEHEEIKLVLNWKSHPCWLALIVLEGTIYATGKEK